MNKLAQRRAKRFAHISKDPQRERMSFRRFYRLAKKPERMPRGMQRRTIKALWKAVGKKPLRMKKARETERKE